MALVLEKAHGTVQWLRVDAHGVETLDASTQLRSIFSITSPVPPSRYVMPLIVLRLFHEVRTVESSTWTTYSA